MDNPDLLAEQIAYYRARAPEYERGLYATAEAQALIGTVVERIPPDADVLNWPAAPGSGPSGSPPGPARSRLSTPRRR